ncbi:MAG: outer membrane beta-barrel protein [Gammaproteobacteria bacterium]|nr:outer membrane beta-barrel protein [Gammaproteobacteria bacterium]
MKLCRLIFVIVISSLVNLTTPIALAAQPGWYIGAGLGNSDPDKGGFDDDTGLRFFGGYNTDGRLAFEGAFVDLGEFDRGAVEFEVDGFQLAALYHFPVGEKFWIFGTAGVYFWDADATGAKDDDGTDVTFGFGLEYDNKRWGIRAGWERFDDVEPNDIDMLSVSGVLYIK